MRSRRQPIITKRKPADWPEVDPNTETTWEDKWGKHTLKKGLLTTDYTQPSPAAMPLKRKYRG